MKKGRKSSNFSLRRLAAAEAEAISKRVSELGLDPSIAGAVAEATAPSREDSEQAHGTADGHEIKTGAGSTAANGNLSAPHAASGSPYENLSVANGNAPAAGITADVAAAETGALTLRESDTAAGKSEKQNIVNGRKVTIGKMVSTLLADNAAALAAVVNSEAVADTASEVEAAASSDSVVPPASEATGATTAVKNDESEYTTETQIVAGKQSSEQVVKSHAAPDKGDVAGNEPDANASSTENLELDGTHSREAAEEQFNEEAAQVKEGAVTGNLTREERLAKLREALMTAHKQQTGDALLQAPASQTAETKVVREKIKLPETTAEKYRLALKTGVIKSSRKVRLFRYKRTRYTAKDLRMSIFDMLAISRNYLISERQIRRQELKMQFASLSDEVLEKACNERLMSVLHEENADEQIKLAANRRRRSRLRDAKIAKFHKLELLFKQYRDVDTEKISLSRTFGNFSRTFRKLRIGSAIVILIIGIVLALAALLPQFYLQDVEVSGNEHLTKEEIIQLFDLENKKGRHLLTFVNGNLAECLQLRNKSMEMKLQDNYPLIAAVTCKVKFPNKIEIAIKETTEIAYIKIPGGYADIDAAGRILSLNMGEPSDYVPLIKGLDVSTMEINKKFAAIDSKSFNNAIMFMDGLMRSDADSNDNLQMITALKSINLMPDFSLWLEFTFDNQALAVHINSDVNNYADQIYWLRNTKQIGALDNLGSGYLDLTGKQKVFVSSENNEQLAESEAKRLKAEVWDESAWTWKNIVVKSFNNRVGD